MKYIVAIVQPSRLEAVKEAFWREMTLGAGCWWKLDMVLRAMRPFGDSKLDVEADDPNE